MKCEEFSKKASDFMNGQMSSVERSACTKHLEICSDCKAHYQQMQTTVKTLNILPKERMKETTINDLITELSNIKHVNKKPSKLANRIRIFIFLDSFFAEKKVWKLVTGLFAIEVLISLIVGTGLGPWNGIVLACLLEELASAAIPLGLIAFVSIKNKQPVSINTCVAAATAATFVEFIISLGFCPYSFSYLHYIVVHSSGIWLAALLGIATGKALQKPA